MHYSPVRHSPPGASTRAAVRLACVKHAASVQSEPGSNSSVQSFFGHPKASVLHLTYYLTNESTHYNFLKLTSSEKLAARNKRPHLSAVSFLKNVASFVEARCAFYSTWRFRQPPFGSFLSRPPNSPSGSLEEVRILQHLSKSSTPFEAFFFALFRTTGAVEKVRIIRGKNGRSRHL